MADAIGGAGQGGEIPSIPVSSPLAVANLRVGGLERRALDCQCDPDTYLERLREYVRRPPPTTLRDLDAELVAFEEEFGAAEIDLESPTLAIVTEPIELEGVEFGRFRILVRCGSVAGPEYEVVSLDAHEPSSSDFANVTHPHVRDDALCEAGPARAAIAISAAYTQRNVRPADTVSAAPV